MVSYIVPFVKKVERMVVEPVMMATCSFRFYSYRDPRLVETFNDFEAGVQWLLNTEQQPHQLEEAILGLVAGMDKPWFTCW